jgi:alpha-glucosidase
MRDRAGRWVVILGVLGGAAWPRPGAAAADVSVQSPNGAVQFRLVPEGGRLTYSVTLAGKPAVESSPLAITIDGTTVSEGVEVGPVDRYRVDETYPTMGNHPAAANRCNGARVNLRRTRGPDWTLDVRAYDDGVAFRYTVDGNGKPRVPDETTRFVLPAGSTVWSHDLNGHYEGVHQAKLISAVPAGTWAAPPLTVRLPNGAGYASITEAALINYAGMALRADGQRGYELVLAHKHPVSYPFKLRYSQEDIDRLAKPAAITGTIISPWRVVLLGADLNTLVNSDIVTSLNPPPDPALFPDGPRTAWVKPGRAAWTYLDGGEKTLAGQQEFCRIAGELGFEYLIVEGFWRKWDDEGLRDLVATGKRHGVGIWLWRHGKELRDPATRTAFFDMCRSFGVAGVKIDFFDHEAKEVVDYYQTLLRETAEHHLLVNFHGSNKPTGESRTWPNELVREAVKGMEASKLTSRARHDATLPFTRFLAGPADYTPVHFGARRGDTTVAHQVATAVVFTAPLLTYGAHPKTLLEHPTAPLVKAIPSVWDETVVLPASAVGEVAGFARRSGETWYLAIVNGPDSRTQRVPLTFLGPGEYQSFVVRDRDGDPAAVRLEEATAGRGDTATIDLSPGGGFVARYTRKAPAALEQGRERGRRE